MTAHARKVRGHWRGFEILRRFLFWAIKTQETAESHHERSCLGESGKGKEGSHIGSQLWLARMFWWLRLGQEVQKTHPVKWYAHDPPFFRLFAGHPPEEDGRFTLGMPQIWRVSGFNVILTGPHPHSHSLQTIISSCRPSNLRFYLQLLSNCMQRPGWNEPGRVLLERVGDSCKETLERLKPFGGLLFGDWGWLSTILFRKTQWKWIPIPGKIRRSQP